MSRHLLHAVSLAVCALAASHASAQTYQLRMVAQGLKPTTATPAPEMEQPQAPPASCVPGQAVFSTAADGLPWTLPAGCTEVTAKVWGAGGGSFSASPAGGAGGFVGGTMTLAEGSTLTLYVGAGGAYSTTLYTNGGGGLSGIWLGDVPVLVAGGGGGAGKTMRGGAAGQNGETSLFVGKGATATTAGAGGCGNSGGTEWAGGTASARLKSTPAGNGGAGRFGGGAGCALYYNGMYIGGAGGGGSSYVDAQVQNPAMLYGSFTLPGNSGDADRGTAGSPSQAGRIVLSYR